MWNGHEGMGWWMLFGSVWILVLWGLVLWAVFTLAAKLSGHAQERGDETALEIARRRYASGEISRDEYERLRADLRQ